jgi:hypothetical protein
MPSWPLEVTSFPTFTLIVMTPTRICHWWQQCERHIATSVNDSVSNRCQQLYYCNRLLTHFKKCTLFYWNLHQTFCFFTWIYLGVCNIQRWLNCSISPRNWKRNYWAGIFRFELLQYQIIHSYCNYEYLFCNSYQKSACCRYFGPFTIRSS